MVIWAAVTVLTCVLDAACLNRLRQQGNTIQQYGAATRGAWHQFPQLPTGAMCAFGAAENLAATAVLNGATGRQASASDSWLAAGMGCATGGSGGGGRKPWQITKDRTDSVVISERFRRISRDKVTGLWWSRDTAGREGSVWKVFKEEASGLRHMEHADMYGDYVEGKHKGPVGEFIPWSQLRGVGG